MAHIQTRFVIFPDARSGSTAFTTTLGAQLKCIATGSLFSTA